MTSVRARELLIAAAGIELQGTLRAPPEPIGLCVVVHGSGQSRHHPAGRALATALGARGLATLLVELLTHDEAEREAFDLTLRADAYILAGRLVAITDWLRGQPELAALPLAFAGSSTGAAAALIAAARRPYDVAAIVARSARPDLAADAIAAVRAPTLLVVGGADGRVLELNRAAAQRFTAPCRLAVVPGAGHMFDEPAAQDEAARLAGDWLAAYLPIARGAEVPHAEVQFADRRAAGAALGRALLHHAGTGAIVLGVPRGGVPVADEVARVLGAPLDVWLVRRLIAPHRPGDSLGALAEGACLLLDRERARELELASPVLLELVHREAAELRRAAARFRLGRARPDVRGRPVVLVDDGVATGATLRAAARAVRREGAARVVAATPVAAPAALAALRGDVDEVVCLSAPGALRSIGAWYRDYRPVAETEILRVLADADARVAAAVTAPEPPRPSLQ